MRRDGFVVYRVKSAGTTYVAIGPADGTSTYEQVGDHGRRAEKNRASRGIHIFARMMPIRAPTWL